ncbi:hypothetical protein H4R34_002817 [Dimargaris verticillata]|uniref:Bromodomain-containing protein n=1 Tax=Dimargaris verticillata TaxID=2761393 RepID=A0A9W8B160_9FUNG|nr:hypothetical protein H4R34_002817 [Dimargaris verticillata]
MHLDSPHSPALGNGDHHHDSIGHVSSPGNALSTSNNGHTATPATDDWAAKRKRKLSARYADYESSKEIDSLFNGAPIAGGIPHTGSHMSKEQVKYCQAMVRTLKRQRDAGPFLEPVDPVKLNIPDYPTIIKHPMDLGTVDKKLTADQYLDVEDFVSDVRLIFSNCYLYNGSESVIAKMAQNLERVFNNQVTKIPGLPQSPLPAHGSPAPGRSSSQSHDGIVTGTPEAVNRPRREIHPPSRELPAATPAVSRRRSRAPADPQLKYCQQVIREIFKRSHLNYSHPFLAPVDPVALNIPDYTRIVKHPMDFGTIKKKLDAGEYHTAQEFEADTRLVFDNCYIFNPPDNPVHQMGKQLEQVFEQKWAGLPAAPELAHESPAPAPAPQLFAEDPSFDDHHGSDYDEPEAQQFDEIAKFERHLEKMARELEAMKRDAGRKKKPGQPPVPSRRRTSQKTTAGKAPGRQGDAVARRDKRTGRPPHAPGHTGVVSSGDEYDVDPTQEISFDQKRELSEKIGQLAPKHMNEVVTIIRSSMPELNDAAEDEIELDIDSLNPHTFWRLYAFVKKHTDPPARKASTASAAGPRTSQSHGATSYTSSHHAGHHQPPAGKRQRLQSAVMEMDQTRRISQLEEKLRQFDSVVRRSPKMHESEVDIEREDDYSSSASGSSSDSGSDSDDSGSHSD